MLELFHWEPNGDSAKVLICLKEKGEEFKSHYVDILNFEQYEKGYLKLAPLGQVPVLAHDGQVFNEPRLLLEYLEDAFPAPRLAASDAAGWYDVQEWIRYADAQLGSSVNLVGWHTAMLPAMGGKQRKEFEERLAHVPVKEQQAGWAAVVRDAESTEDKLENARGKVREAVARMESTLATSSWLVESAYSIADIGAFAIAQALPQLLPAEVNAQKAPKVMDWLQRISARPAVKAALAMRRDASRPFSFMPA